MRTVCDAGRSAARCDAISCGIRSAACVATLAIITQILLYFIAQRNTKHKQTAEGFSYTKRAHVLVLLRLQLLLWCRDDIKASALLSAPDKALLLLAGT
jgi:hypothetical protein